MQLLSYSRSSLFHRHCRLKEWVRLVLPFSTKFSLKLLARITVFPQRPKKGSITHCTVSSFKGVDSNVLLRGRGTVLFTPLGYNLLLVSLTLIHI